MKLRRTQAQQAQITKPPEGEYPVQITNVQEKPSVEAYKPKTIFLIAKVVDGPFDGVSIAQAFKEDKPYFAGILMESFGVASTGTMKADLGQLGGRYAFATVNDSGWVERYEPAEVDS